MATTIQQILDGAILWSDANTTAKWANATREVLERVNVSQQQLSALIGTEAPLAFAVIQSIASSSGSSGRTINLDGTATKVERIIKVVGQDLQEWSQVDPRDIDAELPPRFYQLGEVLYEVGSDWGAAGVRTPVITHVQRPTDLVLTGALSQALFYPDRYLDFFQTDLAWYMAHKDFGRGEAADKQELDRLAAKRDEALQRVLMHITHLTGAQARRFDQPSPAPPEKA